MADGTASDTDHIAQGDAASHRRMGVDLYNHAWTMLEVEAPSAEQVDDMIAAAHASAWHWTRAGGTLANAARSQWLIARVYSTIGRAEPALWHANRCVALAEAAVAAGVAEDWDLAAALEGLARAQLVAGDDASARATAARAEVALESIADPDDREQIERDVRSLALD